MEIPHVYDVDDFAEFASRQPETWTDGKPGFALPHVDESGLLIYSDEQGWGAILARYNAEKMSHGWIMCNDHNCQYVAPPRRMR